MLAARAVTIAEPPPTRDHGVRLQPLQLLGCSGDRWHGAVRAHTREHARASVAHRAAHDIKQRALARQRCAAEDHRPLAVHAIEFAPELPQALRPVEQPQRRRDVLE